MWQPDSMISSTSAENPVPSDCKTSLSTGKYVPTSPKQPPNPKIPLYQRQGSTTLIPPLDPVEGLLYGAHGLRNASVSPSPWPYHQTMIQRKHHLDLANNLPYGTQELHAAYAHFWISSLSTKSSVWGRAPPSTLLEGK